MRIFKKLTIILTIIFAFGLALVAFLKPRYVVPILMYHSVSPDARPQNRLAVTVEAFERQMRFLKERHYNVLPLETLGDLIKEGKKIPPKTLAITFDDGYKDNYLHAFAVLKRYGLPATIFIIVNEVDRPQNDRLSWQEIGTMLDTGLFTFGSHALGPESLTNITSEQELKRQIFESKKTLEEKLKRKVALFSYPEGRFNDKIRQLVKDAGYRIAVATSPGKRFANNDVFALKRLRISSTSDNLFVFWLETAGYYTFIKEHRDED